MTARAHRDLKPSNPIRVVARVEPCDRARDALVELLVELLAERRAKRLLDAGTPREVGRE